MMVFLNGEFVPEDAAKVSIFDRSFLYGDALFETMRVHNGRPFRWAQHWARLASGAKLLGIHLPYPDYELLARAEELIRRNELHEGVLRLHLSRGTGTRGYSPQGADNPLLVLTTHRAGSVDLLQPPHWNLATVSQRLPLGNCLTVQKHANRLLYVLAKQEAERFEATDALLLNTAGNVVEAASANLFWLQNGKVHTPPLSSGALAGVTRSLVMELCQKLELKCTERNIKPAKLLDAEGVFLTLSTLGIVEVTRIDGTLIGNSPLVTELQAAYFEVLQTETARGPHI